MSLTWTFMRRARWVHNLLCMVVVCEMLLEFQDSEVKQSASTRDGRAAGRPVSKGCGIDEITTLIASIS